MLQDETVAQASVQTPLQMWGRRLQRWTLELLLVLCGAMAIASLRGGPPLPKQAPQLRGVTLEGKAVDLRQLRGAPTVLYFHASWCGACRMTTGTVERFARQHPAVHVLGIAAEEAGTAIRHGFPVLVETPEIAKAYPVRALPTTIVLDAQEQVAWARQGVLVPWELELHLP